MRAALSGCALLTALALCGCSDSTAQIGRNSDDALAATSDRQADALSSIPQLPHQSVCYGGRFHCKAHVRVTSSGQIQSFAAAVAGLGPSDLAAAYALNTSLAPNATIAIVDAYGYAKAESDLATYRSNYGLPACTSANGCFKVVNQSGQTSPLPPEPAANDDWTVETALDLDMASAACPNCKILLVQAQDDQGDGLYQAQQAAVNLGATVISNSWGGDDTADAGAAAEPFFNHPGVGEFVAAGDNGYDNGDGNPDYPSTSAYVTAVGGTSLTKSSSPRGWTEGAWSSGGSSCSYEIPKPGYQTNSACQFRAASDVAAVGDPNTGVAVYNNGPSSTGWIVVGGTSASSPFVAGVYALTGHGAAGPAFSYQNKADFYDVTTGSNGTCGNVLCNSGAGWDGPTGNGTPNGKALAGTSCTPNCGGMQCGSDGCGGSCGTCPTGESCDSSGQCVAGCTPQCTGKSCGSDGCGGSCGSCPSGETCDGSGQCVTNCTPSCSGKSCGPDGCGGSCGTCPSGDSCSASGQCVATCTPQCTGKSCGPDGCGGSCGSCSSGQTCSSSGTCQGSSGTCSHPTCSTGGSLSGSCDPCAGQICAVDPYCCQTAWDSVCVSEVGSVCGQSCSGGGGGGGSTCTHSECSTGKKLTKSCDACVTSVCSQDPYCCQVKWDNQCVSEVSWICGESC